MLEVILSESYYRRSRPSALKECIQFSYVDQHATKLVSNIPVRLHCSQPSLLRRFSLLVSTAPLMSFAYLVPRFVLESSKDLKPDPAESAVATLLLISQTLLAMSNQPVSTPVAVVPDPTHFVPSGSAVAVNVLWFTSLILSVSVTLIAMLAKEWSHLFMVGRTGMPMEQARKRQRRFEGMKAWKMAGVITALPTLMHLALCEFCSPS